MMISVLCESPRDRRPQEKCASKCVRRSVSLCLHLFFSILRKGSLTGKAVVLKTTARSACGFESCPFRQVTGMNAKWKAD